VNGGGKGKHFEEKRAKLNEGFLPVEKYEKGESHRSEKGTAKKGGGFNR